MRAIFTILFFLIFLARGLFAVHPIQLTDVSVKYDASQQIEYLIDSSGIVNESNIFESSTWFPPVIKKNSTINLGTSPYVHWFRFSVCNRTDNEDWVLEIDYPTLNEVVFYVFDESNNLDTIIHTGKNLDEEYTYSIFFNQPLQTNKTYTVFIRIRTESFIIMPISILSPKTFVKYDRSHLTYLNTQYGVLLALVLFNLILFALTRELNYLLLTLYLGVLSLNAYYMYGYGYNLFPEMDLFIKNRMRQILFGIGSMLFVAFSINYLELKKYRNFLWSFRILFTICLVYTVLLFFEDIPQRFFSRNSPALYLSGAMLNFVAGIYAFRKGERLAMYYIISFAFITLSSVIYYQTLFNIIPFNLVSFNINAIGTVLFGIFLTIGLIEKITAIRKERERSEQLHTLNLQLQNEIDEKNRIEKALRENEEKFRMLFELSPQPISLTEMETGTIVDVNSQMERLLGIPKATFLGKTAIGAKLIGAGDRKRVVDEVKRTGQALGFDIRLYPPEYEPIDCLIYIRKVTIQSSNILISVFIDITEMKKNQEMLEKSEKQLRELNATKDKFFSIIAHDLMNPFNAMLGFTQLLIESIKKENKQDGLYYGSLIDESARRILDLFQNLLIWSKSQSGKIRFTPIDVSVVELLMTATDVLKAVAYDMKVELIFDVKENLTVCADRNMISTVIRNLVSNAIKFSNQGGIVKISVDKLAEECLFRVADSGVGMQTEQLGQLFQIEKSLESNNQESRLGVGLGLILARDFVNAHGGSIWAESKPGLGSTFSFSIPIKNKTGHIG